jgi:hypothetical protein
MITRIPVSMLCVVHLTRSVSLDSMPWVLCILVVMSLLNFDWISSVLEFLSRGDSIIIPVLPLAVSVSICYAITSPHRPKLALSANQGATPFHASINKSIRTLCIIQVLPGALQMRCWRLEQARTSEIWAWTPDALAVVRWFIRCSAVWCPWSMCFWNCWFYRHDCEHLRCLQTSDCFSEIQLCDIFSEINREFVSMCNKVLFCTLSLLHCWWLCQISHALSFWGMFAKSLSMLFTIVL